MEVAINPLTQIDVDELMDLLNNYLLEIYSQIDNLEQYSLENLNELNYNYIISGLIEFSKMIENNDPAIKHLIEDRFDDEFALHNRALLMFFANMAIKFIKDGYNYAKGREI